MTRGPGSHWAIRSTWALPILIGLLSVVGLVSALTGDGLPDIIAWITLAVPVAAVGWAMRMRRS